MTSYETLKRARALLAEGWSAALTLDHHGRICDPRSEEATTVCMADALEVASAGDVDAYMEAEALLASLAEPRAGRPLYEWELHPRRTKAEVVALFDRAVLRARFVSRGGQA